MGLRDIETNLPPGFRFYPSDEELVCHYLYKKVSNERITEGTMVEVDLHSREPWELPEVAKLSTNEWYFFSFRDRKYATGSRANRATKSGYWKATGKDRTVCDPSSHETVGMRKTLVFYRGRAPNGIKSGWVMHEFRLENPHSPPKEDWVLCRVFHKRKAEEEMNMSSSPPQVMVEPEHHPLQEEGSYDGTSLFSSGPHHEPFTDGMASFNFLHYNFLDFPPQTEAEVEVEVEVGSTYGETAGFLLDLGFDDEQGMDGYRCEGGRDGLY